MQIVYNAYALQKQKKDLCKRELCPCESHFKWSENQEQDNKF
jgi:hypothetical protein